MNLLKFGINQMTDHSSEETVSIAGMDGQMPIALFLMYSSKQPKSIARYFNLMTYTTKAKKCENDFLKQNIDIEKIEKRFNQEDIVHELPQTLSITPDNFFEKFSMKDLEKPNYEVELELYLYTDKFYELMAMQTRNFEGSEGIIMTCPLSSIQYWNRPEFTQVYEVLEKALIHILEDVVKIMKKRGVSINESTMTIEVPEYKSIVVRECYMF